MRGFRRDLSSCIIAVLGPGGVVESQTAYDRVDYPGWPYPQSHPDRLATLATLFGMSPADPANCRVLELGCGDGANLLPIAVTWPATRVVGIDLAASAIGRGRRMVDELALANIDLRVGDIARLPGDLGEFDYVIAHGVYSWVPAHVREALLAACHRHLAPEGVAFVSYNVHPGGHLRSMLREAVLMHVESIDEPVARTAAARDFLDWIRQAQNPIGDPSYPTALAQEAERLSKRTDAGLFHDDLAGEFHLCYFRDFCREAGAHELQFLAEAEFAMMQDTAMPKASRARMGAFAPGLVEREQYLDFVRERRFRQSLLCHGHIALRSEVRADALWSLSISCSAQPDGEVIDPTTGAEQRYRGRDGAVFVARQPLAKAMLARLRAEWPRALPLRELLGTSAALCGLEPGESTRRMLADFALECYCAGQAEMHFRQAPFAATAGSRPRASPLAQWQANHGNTVTGIIGNTVALDDSAAVHVLRLLDGTRDRAALLREVGGDLESLDRCLQGLARCALLLDAGA